MTRVAIYGLRFALAITLLSAVADRFGIWGPNGAANVSWGDWNHFVAYCAIVNSFLPASWAAPLAWLATLAEILLGLALILGFRQRETAYASFALFAAFALAMVVSLGTKAPLNYSVFVDAFAALLLATASKTSRP